MKFLVICVVLLGTLFNSVVASNSQPETYEEAKVIIQDYVASYKKSGGLCDKNTCCTMSSTESCSISGFNKDTTTMVLPGGSTRCIFSDSTPFAFQVPLFEFFFFDSYLDPLLLFLCFSGFTASLGCSWR
jgi:hypothetical protein